MSLRLVTAARTESLVAQYVRDREALVIGPFEREAIVVARTNGMRTWVENTLAERLGCAASLQIASPRGFVAQLAQAMGVLPRGPAGQAFERPALAWRIAALLDRGGLSGDLYAPLHAYLQAQHETRLDGAVSLASRLATVYDDYQIYRPEVLEAWSQQEPAVPSFPHEPWQAHLWRRLRHASSEETGREIDRAEMARDLLARLGAPPPGGGRPAGLPPAVSVFGASLFPPVYFRVLRAAAAHVPVTLYVTVPGADRLGGLPHDWEPTHPLLRDLGAATRETGRVWHRLGLVPEIHLPAPDPAPTALGALQHALLTDTAPAVTEAADDTLCVTDAHSVVRELEVLRDHLLDAFEHVDGLTPDEVGILVPDLATYAPLVDAVFGNAGVGMRLPYHIADHPQAPEVRVLGAFERLLALGDGRASASDVLGLLDVPAVRRAAEIRESELSLVHEWTREACVHWGRDAQHKAAVGLPEDDLHTWQFGLDRLLLGYALGPTEAEAPVLGRLPLAETTTDEADLLGRFCEWVRELFRRLDSLTTARAAAAWSATLLRFADDVLMPRTDAEVRALITLRQATAGLVRLGASDREVPFAEVRAHLMQAIADATREEPYLTGRITVGNPIMLRGIPFRVLAFVGLGDRFPRTENRPAFDLLAHERRDGDPDPHGTDQQLFLDALLAARDRLILSYVGRSQKDNSERAPSVVLDAFLDTCRRTFGERGLKRIVTRHRLQPSDPDYFDAAHPHLFTYDARQAPRAIADATGHFFTPPEPGADPASVPTGEAVDTTLDELRRAWQSPCRYHADHLGLDLRLDEARLDDDEPVDLDALGRYVAKDTVLLDLVRDDTEADPAALRERLLLSGRLPPGDMGDALATEVIASAGDVARRIRAHGDTKAVPVVISGPEGAWRVEGALALHRTNGVLRARPATVKGKDLLGGWIDHLALSASGLMDVPRTVVVGEDTAWVFREPPGAQQPSLTPDEAQLFLQFLVRGMLAFRQIPAPLFERASHAYVNAFRSKRRGWLEEQCTRIVASEAQGFRPIRASRMTLSGPSDQPDTYGLKEARKKYNGPYEQVSDVTTDAAVALCYRNRHPLDEMPGAFDRWARMLWGPIFTYAEELA